ncbi:MAG: hypothetical protein QOG03_11 [Actinomycetota bacterium]|jgi:hypothetical protein|nr:hypothetical protein [Actinomycetota bacterium]
MGLFERLQAKEKAREGDDELIDLTERGQTPAPQPVAARQKWGRPGPCPDCGGDGFLDHIDMIDRIMYQHCTDCLHKWQVTESELAQQSSS